MKEIKAFIRKHKAEEVVDALEAAGITCITIMDVMGVGSLADPEESQLSMRIAERYSDLVNVVIVCRDDRIANIINILREAALTGHQGDGIVYVTPVEQAIHIRTGRTGDAVL